MFVKILSMRDAEFGITRVGLSMTGIKEWPNNVLIKLFVGNECCYVTSLY